MQNDDTLIKMEGSSSFKECESEEDECWKLDSSIHERESNTDENEKIMENSEDDSDTELNCDNNSSNSKEGTTKTNDINISLHICSFCGDTFHSFILLEKHLDDHSGEDFRFNCEQCDKSYTEYKKLKRHKYTHRYELSVNCKVCQKHFTSLTNLRRHMGLHNKNKPFSCIICKESFVRRDKINMHMLTIHGLQLADCIKLETLENSLNMDSHERQNSKMSNNEGNLNSKLDSLSQIKDEVSDDSRPSTSKQNDGVINAERLTFISKSVGLYYCEICDKDFANVSVLKRHMTMHNGERPFSCRHCHKKFCDLSELKEHVKIHESDSQLICDVCFKFFSDKANLRRHKLIHSGDKPFGCDICSKRFIRKDHLKAHRLIHVWNGEVDNETRTIEKEWLLKKNIKNVSPTGTGLPNNVLHNKDRNCKEDQKTLQTHKHVSALEKSDDDLNGTKCNKKTKQKRDKPGKKPYICIECNKIFTKCSNLKRHRLTHLNKTKWKPKKGKMYVDPCVGPNNEAEQMPSVDSRLVEKKQSCDQASIWNPFLDSKSSQGNSLNKCDKNTGSNGKNKNKKCNNVEYQSVEEEEDSQLDEVYNEDDAGDQNGESELEKCGPGKETQDLSNQYDECEYTSDESVEYNDEESYNDVNYNEDITYCDEEQSNGDVGVEIKKVNEFIEISVPSIKKETAKQTDGKKWQSQKIIVDDSNIHPELLKLKSKIEVFTCDKCKVVFKSRILLRRHECPYKEVFACDDCGKKFLYISTLRTHQVVHSKEKPFQCGVCMKRFALFHHLRGHMLIHTGEKPYECRDCRKKFTNSSDLKKHTYSHTGERQYSCDQCPKMFKRPCDVTRHKLTHSGVRPHVCGYCNKTFSQAPHLNSHMVIHFRESQPTESKEIVFGEEG